MPLYLYTNAEYSSDSDALIIERFILFSLPLSYLAMICDAIVWLCMLMLVAAVGRGARRGYDEPSTRRGIVLGERREVFVMSNGGKNSSTKNLERLLYLFLRTNSTNLVLQLAFLWTEFSKSNTMYWIQSSSNLHPSNVLVQRLVFNMRSNGLIVAFYGREGAKNNSLLILLI